jgi:hypothetical protein
MAQVPHISEDWLDIIYGGSAPRLPAPDQDGE